jgi:hypothetical protein
VGREVDRIGRFEGEDKHEELQRSEYDLELGE